MSYQPAGFVKRAIAYIIDIIILGIIGSPFIFLSGLGTSLLDPSVIADPVTLLTANLLTWIIDVIIFLIYWVVVPSLLDGQSIGKKLIGVQVRKLMPDGSTESTKGMYVTHLLRAIGWIIDAICCIGCLLVLFTEKKQRVGDMIAGTIVVD
ncbi:MAG: RDD family protein [Candidatus Hodarchaeota archaeon]